MAEKKEIWYKIFQKGLKCLMCGLIIFQIDGKEIKKCPNCKFNLTEIKEVRFLNFGDKLFIQTNPN